MGEVVIPLGSGNLQRVGGGAARAGVLVVVLSPFTGRLVGAGGPRLPLVVAGAALALAGGASVWLGPAIPLPAVLAIYLLFGIFPGTVGHHPSRSGKSIKSV